MKVIIDLDPRDLWTLTEQAERQGLSLPDFLAARMTTRAPTVQDRIRDMHAQGMCDADIAAELAYLPGTVAGIRRALGLKPNPRYRTRKETA